MNEIAAQLGVHVSTIKAWRHHQGLAPRRTVQPGPRRIRQIIGRDIKRFASREGLTVEWLQPSGH